MICWLPPTHSKRRAPPLDGSPVNLAHYNLRACGSFRMFHERFRVDEFDIGEPAVNGGRQGGRATASTAQPRTATEAAVESVASSLPSWRGLPESQADANTFR